MAARLAIVDLGPHVALRSEPITPQLLSLRTAVGFVAATAGAVRTT
jgi:hypothetical protein